MVKRPSSGLLNTTATLTSAMFLLFGLGQDSLSAAEEEVKVEQRRDVRPLPGGLDAIPVFNSNSPEIVTGEGILLSTFPSCEGPAHLNYSFDGRFDIFAHHIADGKKSGHLEELHLGLILGNSGKKKVTVEILRAASYLSQPDAPFIPLEAILNNDDGKIFAGPGDRVTNEILQDKKNYDWKSRITVRPGEKVLVKSLPIPVRTVVPNLNGRSLLMRLKSEGPVHAALVARFAPMMENGVHRSPTAEEFIATLNQGKLVEPREAPPTPPDEKGGVRYGRVSGVASGSQWRSIVTDKDKEFLALPDTDKPISYVISSLKNGTFGTNQVQSAPMVVRNPGTAYQAHGNYGIKYDLVFPLKNTSSKDLKLRVALETPVKTDEKRDTVTFINPVPKNVWFRGTIKVGEGPGRNSHYVHVVEHRAETLGPIFTKVLKSGDSCKFHVELIYPPDCTPPQLLTLSTSSDIE